LIDWNNIPDDPVFVLNFPQSEMLEPQHFKIMAAAINAGGTPKQLNQQANIIRNELNPNPAGQSSHNVPVSAGNRLPGIQHKYRETVLFFPLQGQTCHAYCTFCFRWPQFVGMDELKFASRQTGILKDYLQRNHQVTDVLFTGGDPLIMRTSQLRAYIEPLLELPHLQNIRIGSKALAYWPYRFTTDKDADDLLRLFEEVVQSGKQLALMAHFNHYQELRTSALKVAVRQIRNSGAVIRTQSALLRHINADPKVWKTMWQEQVKLGMIPYYMFIARDTGAQNYFAVPLGEAQKIFAEAYRHVGGLSRTVRGPSMSCHPGKVRIIGTPKIKGERVFALEMIQGRDPSWVGETFFAQYDPNAIWLTDLKPAFGEVTFPFEKKPHIPPKPVPKTSLPAYL
jgi:KamA family protein